MCFGKTFPMITTNSTIMRAKMCFRSLNMSKNNKTFCMKVVKQHNNVMNNIKEFSAEKFLKTKY